MRLYEFDPKVRLAPGSRGDSVRQYQNYLVKLGYDIAVDGVYGPATANAVKQFQQKNNLTADGILGPSTAQAIEKEIPAQSTTTTATNADDPEAQTFVEPYNIKEKRLTTNLLDLIGRLESNNNDEALYPNKTVSGLSSMTVAQVLDYQTNLANKQRQAGQTTHTAIGRYQIIRSTLSELIKKGIVSQNDKFDSDTQAKLAKALLNRRGFEKYLQGQLSKEQLVVNLSNEWEALKKNPGLLIKVLT